MYLTRNFGSIGVIISIITSLHLIIIIDLERGPNINFYLVICIKVFLYYCILLFSINML
jgi:hypothetical protein